MKNWLVAGLTVGLVLAASPSFAAKKNFKAVIEGSAAGSPGTGTGNFTFDDVTKKLCGKATYTGLTGGAVNGVALKNANDQTLVKALTPSTSPIQVNLTLNDNEIALLNAVPGDLYIAIGNAQFPVSNANTDNGEVNGELIADPQGVEQNCPGSGAGDGGADGGGKDGGTGVDSGASSSSSSSSSSGAASSSSSSSSGGSSSSSSSGEATPPGAEPEPTKKPAEKDDGGCSTSGAASSGGFFLAGFVAVLLARRGRSQKKR